MTRTDATCPGCGFSPVVSRREAELMFRSGTVTREALAANPDVTYICPRCYNMKR